MRVLIVDDVEASRETLRRALAFDDGIEVVGEAGSGREAVARAEELRPDLVLMDVRMPDGNGVEATQRIVGRFPATKVVALTAHDDVDTVREMLTAGATGYYLKGASVDQLLEAVHGASRGEGRIDDRVLPNALDELRRLLREEREQRAEIEEMSRTRQEFVHVLSHELRTPLTVMSGALKFLEHRGLRDDEEPLVTSALQRAKELERMIEGLELIAESRPRSEPDANPAAALQGALDRLDGTPDETRCRADRWAGVRGRHLGRILYELLDNAFRHGMPPVTVEAVRRGGLGVLRVMDAGAAEIPPLLFEAFSQGDMSATREQGGLGIGLFVATRLCEADGGRLVVERRGDRTVAEVVYEIGA